MLADPAHSRIVLINPSRGFKAVRREALTLLPFAYDVFNVITHIIGEHDPRHVPEELAKVSSVLGGQALSLWNDLDLVSNVDVRISTILFGGAWLEEDVLIAALEGLKRGFDIRLLADLSIERRPEDRSLVFSRLALHGVPVTTVRQTLLEWSSSLGEEGPSQKVREMLS